MTNSEVRAATFVVGLNVHEAEKPFNADNTQRIEPAGARSGALLAAARGCAPSHPAARRAATGHD